MKYSSKAGFTLVEMLIVIAVTVMVFGALFMTVQYTIRLVADSKAKTSALSLANDRLEYLRSLPYDEVGTVSGIPAGAVPQHSTTTLNGILFSERVLIEYVDDPADGLLTATTTDSNGIPADYKRVKVEITWNIYETTQSISLVSNIVPRSIETTDGGGTVRINVIGADSTPLAGASVTLINDTTTPTINVTKLSDVSGTALFSGAPAASNYEVVVTGVGYSTDQTYAATVSNPNPITAPFSVLASYISTLTFQIGELSNLTLRTFSNITDGRRDEWFDDASGIATSTNATVASGLLRIEEAGGVYKPSAQVYLSALSPASIENWEAVTIAATDSLQTSYLLKMYTVSSSTYTLIPDSDLPGNSAGFSGPIIDLTTLSATTYPSLVVGISLSTSNTSVTPSVDAVEIFYQESSTARTGVSFTAHGAKVIGHDSGAQPIYKKQLSATTDGQGEAEFTDVEFDSYEFNLPAAYTVARSCPTLPLQHREGIDSVLEMVLVSSVTNSLLVSVVDIAGREVPGASVELSRTGYSQVSRSGNCGQVFFSSGVIAAADYTVTVSKSGYSTVVLNSYDLNGNSSVKVILSES